MIEIINKTLLKKRYFSIAENFDYYYPVKANDNPEILKMLNNLGSGFLVCDYEHALLLINNLKVSSKKILYLISINNLEIIEKITLLGINQFIVENPESILILKKLNVQCKLILRISTSDIEFDRFGENLDDVGKYFDLLNNSKVKFVGFHFHIPAKCNSFRAFKKIFHKIIYLYPNLEFLDIGGGYSLKTLSLIKDFISANFTIKNIACEVGYSFINDLVYLETNVLSVKYFDSVNVATIDAGIYSGLLDVFISGRKFLIVSTKKSKVKLHYRLYGPSLDHDDYIGDYLLPTLDVGDKLIIKDTGAYVRTLQTLF